MLIRSPPCQCGEEEEEEEEKEEGGLLLLRTGQ